MSDKAVPHPVLAWEQFKNGLSALVHLTHHQLHVVVGVGLFVGFARLLRKPLGSFLPLLPVATLELINEASDFTRYYTSGWPWTPYESIVDVELTLGPPLGVILVARLIRLLRPALMPRQSSGGGGGPVGPA